MLKLRAVYPYGHLVDEYKKEDSHVLLGNKFPPLPEHTIKFLVEHFMKIVTLFLLMSFSLN